MVRLFIAGTTGVLGRHLVPLLLEDDRYSIITIARHPAAVHQLYGEAVEVLEGDLLGDNIDTLLHEALAAADIAVHLATRIPTNPTGPADWTENNRLRAEFTPRLITAMMRRRVRHLVAQSIEMAYPDRGDEWIDEDCELDDSSERARFTDAVRSMEQSIRDTDPAVVGWTILRGGRFIGPGTFEDALVQRLREGTERLPQNPNAWLSLVSANDMARAVLHSIEFHPSRRIYNVNADPIRHWDYIGSLCRKHGIVAPNETDPSQRLISFRCSNELIRTELEWTPTAI